ncbi:hypothetical protein FOZ61_003635 [Perkinsus olseni]|uniref:Uncharacterized protein n=1 Tax=Perkinsus olseni TaxID=32597 RepID=A0A7J6LP20_PEROL|nr:hypothetical protein FOZ61_003635 [Perkinsus olseni]
MHSHRLIIALLIISVAHAGNPLSRSLRRLRRVKKNLSYPRPGDEVSASVDVNEGLDGAFPVHATLLVAAGGSHHPSKQLNRTDGPYGWIKERLERKPEVYAPLLVAYIPARKLFSSRPALLAALDAIEELTAPFEIKEFEINGQTHVHERGKSLTAAHIEKAKKFGLEWYDGDSDDVKNGVEAAVMGGPIMGFGPADRTSRDRRISEAQESLAMSHGMAPDKLNKSRRPFRRRVALPSATPAQ